MIRILIEKIGLPQNHTSTFICADWSIVNEDAIVAGVGDGKLGRGLATARSRRTTTT
jgi:hypothetical protein